MMGGKINLTLSKTKGGSRRAATEGRKTKVHGTTELNLTATSMGSGTVRGMDATSQGENLISGIGAVNFSLNGHAMSAEDSGSKNTIEDANKVIIGAVYGYGLHAKDGRANLIKGTQAAAINLSRGAAMHADVGNDSNLIMDKTGGD